MPAEAEPRVLAGMTALITGGGTGFGRSSALAFAHAGACVAVAGRRKEPLAAVVSEITAAGGKAIAISGDVTRPADCQKVIQECVRQLGPLHILVNNAGSARLGALEQTSDEDIAHLLDVNLRSVLLMSKYAIPELKKHKDAGTAAILNIGTGVAVAAVKNFAPYAAAKAGVVHLTRCLALELAEARVRVNCINPGPVDTPLFATMMPPAAVKFALKSLANQTPLGRLGKPEDIAAAALFLCSPRASWITGAVLAVDGGIALA